MIRGYKIQNTFICPCVRFLTENLFVWKSIARLTLLFSTALLNFNLNSINLINTQSSPTSFFTIPLPNIGHENKLLIRRENYNHYDNHMQMSRLMRS